MAGTKCPAYDSPVMNKGLFLYSGNLSRNFVKKIKKSEATFSSPVTQSVAGPLENPVPKG
jgi:hypothetical protein